MGSAESALRGKIAELNEKLKQSKDAEKEWRAKEADLKEKLRVAEAAQLEEKLKSKAESELRAKEAEINRLREEIYREKEEKIRRQNERLNYSIPSFLSAFVHDVENVDGEKKYINVGIVGNSGVGKSSFINMARGFVKKNEAPSGSWAAVGVNETTMSPKPYALEMESLSNITVNLWDLPGVGTPRYPGDEYFKTVGLRHFDIVILMSAARFTDHDFNLKKELHRVKIPYFFVRNKVDSDIENNQEINDIPKEKTMASIVDDLASQGVHDPFLISSKKGPGYDFEPLVKAIKREMAFQSVIFK
jgi:small GTP-binding protein